MSPLKFRRSAARDALTHFVIAPHHPDRLRRPLSPPTSSDEDLLRQTLTWNVFRTLELISPSFWLRRFHLRLTGDAALVPSHILKVQLWPALPLPAVQRIDGGRQDVIVDVLIETEHDVWSLIVPSQGALPNLSDRAAEVVDAAGWLAGRRPHHAGVVEHGNSDAGIGALLQARYSRSRESAVLRSASRGPAAPTAAAWGVVRWSDLAAILAECANTHNLPAIERELARNAVDWLQTVDVDRTG